MVLPYRPLRDANAALFEALRGNLRNDMPVVEIDANINDAAFARACAETLLGEMKQ